MALEFVDLPVELIEAILVACRPQDVAQVAQTCRFLRTLIYESPDDALWRELYLLQELDDPRSCVGLSGEVRLPVDWKGELQKYIRACTVVAQKSMGRRGELARILNTLIQLVSRTPYRPYSNPAAGNSETLVTIQALLYNGWIDYIKEQRLDDREEQLINQLHVYFGLTSTDLDKAARVKARSFVYNMENYSWDNDFGPYHKDGRVNWVHVNAIRNVVSMQILLTGFGDEMSSLKENTGIQYNLYPLSMPYTQPIEQREGAAENDWAAVEGEWMVSFCFCDHRELLVFNDEVEGPGFPADTSIFEAEDFTEAFRCRNVNMKITKTEPDTAHPNHPVIYFIGAMGSDSLLHGTVRMTKEGYPCWRFSSGEGGNVIWSSNGVQIGGLRSEYGVLGAWTTVFHDQDDPVGPFWLRKVPPRIGEEDAKPALAIVAEL